MFDRLRKTGAPPAVNVLDVQVEPPFLLPNYASKRPADVLLACNKTFTVSTSDVIVRVITKVAIDITCFGPPASPSLPLREMGHFWKTRNSFAPFFYKHLSEAEKRKWSKKHKADSVSVPQLLATNDIAFLPFAVDSLGGLGPSAAFRFSVSKYSF